ncbi:hypothetical protein [Nocardioides sp. HDW12B]|uniref:hypothetical protein n=1 Tax=Nocardioides sp. HDW12B TaxID=2714939 RepID=UPI001F102B9D|nr:hypothetical protein [Nocardioides sp. HDW12B]
MTTDSEQAAQFASMEPDDCMAGAVHPSGSPVLSGAVDSNEEEALHPINWNLLTADEAEAEWLDLNAWVHWLRATYGLPPTVIPPFWHRHDELVWELSALHMHWLNAYDQDGSPSAPLAWHRDFADARNRLREWVSTCGTKLDRNRPTRLTTWPGEEPAEPGVEVAIEHREADFCAYVMEDVAARQRIEDRARAVAGAS